MRFQTSHQLAYLGGSYVPLSLTAEYYELYLQPSPWTAGTGRGPTRATYDFSSDLVPGRQLRTQRTVEEIVAHGYFAVPPGTLETALISDKRHTSHLGLDSLIRQIRQRYEIFQRNVYEIEWAKCAAMNAVHVREAERGFVSQTDREFYSLSKNLQALYQQQRDERVSLWQDVSRIKQALPEAAQLYLASYRKTSILEDMGDGP